MQYWDNFQLEGMKSGDVVRSNCPKGGIIRIILRILLVSLEGDNCSCSCSHLKTYKENSKSEAYKLLKSYVCDSGFPHSRNERLVLRIIGCIVTLLRDNKKHQLKYWQALYDFLEFLVKRHKGAIKLKLLDFSSDILIFEAIAACENQVFLYQATFG